MADSSGFSIRGRIIFLPVGERFYAHADRLRPNFGSLLATSIVDPYGRGADKDGCFEVLFKVADGKGQQR